MCNRKVAFKFSIWVEGEELSKASLRGFESTEHIAVVSSILYEGSGQNKGSTPQCTSATANYSHGLHRVNKAL